VCVYQDRTRVPRRMYARYGAEGVNPSVTARTQPCRLPGWGLRGSGDNPTPNVTKENEEV